MTEQQNAAEMGRTDQLAREAAAEGEWAEMDPAQAARWDEVYEAQHRAEASRVAMLEAAEARRQAMLAGDTARTASEGQSYRDAQASHQAADLEFTSRAWQARTADREAGS